MNSRFTRVGVEFDAPVAVFDLRDDYAEARGGRVVSVPARGPLSIRLVLATDGEGLGPELVLRRTPSGKQAWFGRVNSAGSARTVRPERARFSIESAWFQPCVTEPVELPAHRDALTVSLQPNYAYPSFAVGGPPQVRHEGDRAAFRPSLVRGAVQARADGVRRRHRVRIFDAGRNAVVDDSGSTFEYVTDDTGEWVFWLDVRADQDAGENDRRFTVKVAAPGRKRFETLGVVDVEPGAVTSLGLSQSQ